jgi:replicative DNA helicase
MDRLPSNAEAEAAILGGILLRGGAALAEVQGRVLADEFYDPRYRAVYSALESIALRGERSTW